MRRRLAVGAITMLTAVAAAGCGDDGKGDQGAGTTPAATPLTRPQFIAAADKVCDATNKKISKAATKLREAGAKTGTLRVPDVAQFFIKSSLPAYEEQLDELRALGTPKGDEKAIDGYVAALAAAIDAVKADPSRFARNNSSDPFDDANARAKSYGLKVCGTS